MLSNTLQTVKYYNLNIKKKFGQNFLIDQNIIKKIIDAVDVTENDTIIEIGPGIGTLTQFLLDANKIFAIELDKDLVKVLQEKFAAQKNLQIINADILKFDLQKLIDSKNVKIVSNLPYYISTAVITKCLTLQIQSMIVMVQKEVGERILHVRQQNLTVHYQFSHNFMLTYQKSQKFQAIHFYRVQKLNQQ